MRDFHTKCMKLGRSDNHVHVTCSFPCNSMTKYTFALYLKTGQIINFYLLALLLLKTSSEPFEKHEIFIKVVFDCHGSKNEQPSLMCAGSSSLVLVFKILSSCQLAVKTA